MCATPIALAVGSTWNRVADEASTIVCRARWWASTRRHASGYSDPEMPCTNSRSPSSASSSSLRPAQVCMPSAVNCSKSSSLVTPRMPVSSIRPRSAGETCSDLR
jgi:hypothetical protein